MGCAQGNAAGAKVNKSPSPKVLSPTVEATAPPPDQVGSEMAFMDHPKECSFSKTKSRNVGHLDSAQRIRCCERKFPRQDEHLPVKMVVFDLDETLTLATFMPHGEWDSFPEEKQATIVEFSFESPWVKGSRLEKLRMALEDLMSPSNGDGSNGTEVEQRMLCILSRNRGGVKSVLGLLQHAGLSHVFSAIWTMPWTSQRECGAYQVDGKWSFFNPPGGEITDHKADWLKHLVGNTVSWLPQLADTTQANSKGFLSMQLEEIALVDDQRTNFYSPSGISLSRCCKVARYDADYRDIGLLRNMGGIGAHSDSDYEQLLRFIREPWRCKEHIQCKCIERPFQAGMARHPVRLVVFDFDETLTLATFTPADPDFDCKLDWTPHGDGVSDWKQSDLVKYNFDTPFVGEGERVQKLKKCFEDLKQADDGHRRVLAVLTRNEHGVAGVYNLLKLAGLAEHFSAIWKLPWCDKTPNGLYQEGGEWKTFDPPIKSVHSHKADVLEHVSQNVPLWFPQYNGEKAGDTKELTDLNFEGIVMVDDERANFQSDKSDTHAAVKVLRFCKVARYDDNYRDCGHVSQMGGLGAHTDEDYETLKNFVERPWEFHSQSAEARTSSMRSIASISIDIQDEDEENEARTSQLGLFRSTEHKEEAQPKRDFSKSKGIPQQQQRSSASASDTVTV